MTVGKILFGSVRQDLLSGFGRNSKSARKLKQVCSQNPALLSGVSALSIGNLVSCANVTKVDDNPNCDYVYSLPQVGMLC